MKDSRVAVFRKTLEGLLESLDATLRVTRWTGVESVPEPLKERASHLVVRLGTADRLASSKFNGSPPDVAKVNTMLGAMRRLDAAYVAYNRHTKGTPSEREDAEMTLDAEIHGARSDAGLPA